MSDTETRDQLAQIIYDTLSGQYGDFSMPDDAAKAILAAGFRPPARTVSTVEEAEALPNSTLIVDLQGDSGYVWQGAVHYPETAVLSVAYAVKHYGPFKVIYEPEAGE